MEFYYSGKDVYPGYTLNMTSFTIKQYKFWGCFMFRGDGIPIMIVGYGIGALGYGLGLILSSVLDLPSGAVIVWMIAIIALLPGFFIKYTIKGTLPFSQ
ncbi:hypothetical protein [Candidatus Venteria ishoeyi]|uniref:hypothetical protein n=1 Tax=Candidatus Venteria ishoeyi TaxID=1899563 RepID=UPI000CDE87F9|nr:hypothetical protein [Candidatus Venteria ishoeyi]